MINYTIAAFFSAMVLAFAIIPISKRLAVLVGLVDHPDKRRKLHKNAIPMIGGIAVFLSVMITLLVLGLWFKDDIGIFTSGNKMLLGLLIACTSILTLGIIDDRFNIRGRQKLLGQILIASVLVYFCLLYTSPSPRDS